MGGRGQAGPLGEDFISLIVVVLAVVVLVVFLLGVLQNQFFRFRELDMYRVGWVVADGVSTEWAYNPYCRVLDAARVCSNCSVSFSGYNFSYLVWSLRDSVEVCSCGPSSYGGDVKVIRLPTALRLNRTDTVPSVLEVRVWSMN